MTHPECPQGCVVVHFDPNFRIKVSSGRVVAVVGADPVEFFDGEFTNLVPVKTDGYYEQHACSPKRVRSDG